MKITLVKETIMKKLDDIPKKEVFNVPEGYFDKLPGIIQARVAAPSAEPKPVWGFALRYALPAIVLLAIGIFWFTSSREVMDTEQLLASIETADLVAYINDSDMTTEELLADVQLDNADAEAIEEEVIDISLEGENLDDIITEMDLTEY